MHLRGDYIILVKILFAPTTHNNQTCKVDDTSGVENDHPNRDEFFGSLGAFQPSNKGRNPPSARKFGQLSITYLVRLNEIMQHFCTQIVEVQEKDDGVRLAI